VLSENIWSIQGNPRCAWSALDSLCLAPKCFSELHKLFWYTLLALEDSNVTQSRAILRISRKWTVMLAREITAVQFRPLRSDLSVCRCCCLFEFRDQRDCFARGDSNANERANEIGHHRAIIESANEKRAVAPENRRFSQLIQSCFRNPIMLPGGFSL
jgi:hypothetical protein